MYFAALPTPEPMDSMSRGRAKEPPPDMGYFARAAVAFTITKIGSSECITTNIEAHLRSLLSFIVSHGVVDKDQTVRTGMLAAGRSVIDAYGVSVIDTILSFLNEVKVIVNINFSICVNFTFLHRLYIRSKEITMI